MTCHVVLQLKNNFKKDYQYNIPHRENIKIQLTSITWFLVFAWSSHTIVQTNEYTNRMDKNIKHLVKQQNLLINY